MGSGKMENGKNLKWKNQDLSNNHHQVDVSSTYFHPTRKSMGACASLKLSKLEAGVGVGS